MRYKIAVLVVMMVIGALLLAACGGAAATNAGGISATLPPVAGTAAGTAVSAAGTAVVGAGELATLGKTVYSENCAGCHGVNGEGGAGPALTNNALVTGAPEALIGFILQGKNGSHAFADKLTDQQIAAVLTHIRINMGNSATQLTEDQVKSLR